MDRSHTPMTKPAARPAADIALGSGSLSSLAKLQLAAEIVAAYGRARWLLRRDRLPSVIAQLRRPPRSAGRPLLPDVDRDGVRLGSIVTRTLAPLPANTMCLMQSLVLIALLARRGRSGTVVIAVRPGAEPNLTAHAWVQLADRPLLAPADGEYGHLLTL